MKRNIMKWWICILTGGLFKTTYILCAVIPQGSLLNTTAQVNLSNIHILNNSLLNLESANREQRIENISKSVLGAIKKASNKYGVEDPTKGGARKKRAIQSRRTPTDAYFIKHTDDIKRIISNMNKVFPNGSRQQSILYQKLHTWAEKHIENIQSSIQTVNNKHKRMIDVINSRAAVDASTFEWTYFINNELTIENLDYLAEVSSIENSQHIEELCKQQSSNALFLELNSLDGFIMHETVLNLYKVESVIRMINKKTKLDQKNNEHTQNIGHFYTELKNKLAENKQLLEIEISTRPNSEWSSLVKNYLTNNQAYIANFKENLSLQYIESLNNFREVLSAQIQMLPQRTYTRKDIAKKQNILNPVVVYYQLHKILLNYDLNEAMHVKEQIETNLLQKKLEKGGKQQNPSIPSEAARATPHLFADVMANYDLSTEELGKQSLKRSEGTQYNRKTPAADSAYFPGVRSFTSTTRKPVTTTPSIIDQEVSNLRSRFWELIQKEKTTPYAASKVLDKAVREFSKSWNITDSQCNRTDYIMCIQDALNLKTTATAEEMYSSILKWENLLVNQRENQTAITNERTETIEQLNGFVSYIKTQVSNSNKTMTEALEKNQKITNKKKDLNKRKADVIKKLEELKAEHKKREKALSDLEKEAKDQKEQTDLIKEKGLLAQKLAAQKKSFAAEESKKKEIEKIEAIVEGTSNIVDLLLNDNSKGNATKGKSTIHDKNKEFIKSLWDWAGLPKSSLDLDIVSKMEAQDASHKSTVSNLQNKIAACNKTAELEKTQLENINKNITAQSAALAEKEKIKKEYSEKLKNSLYILNKENKEEKDLMSAHNETLMEYTNKIKHTYEALHRSEYENNEELTAIASMLLKEDMFAYLAEITSGVNHAVTKIESLRNSSLITDQNIAECEHKRTLIKN
ncbi:hypothetical protein NEIRO03_1644 [Nematocida sp. AWRm78]|nr:hypothetical protein NEIRO03_1644 [Nematocida sp. AWRm78]